jgi:Haem-NO-binding
MHGSLLHGLKQFVVAREGETAWDQLVRATGVQGWYFSTRIYPDEELTALIQAAASRWKQPVSVVLEDFGTALAPTLMALYRSFIEPTWRTFDVLMHVESVIHRTVRLRDLGAAPPRLIARKVSDREIHIDYSSDRKLCAVAIGLCRGVAAHYGDMVTIEQPACMNTGAAFCRLVVRFGPQ